MKAKAIVLPLLLAGACAARQTPPSSYDFDDEQVGARRCDCAPARVLPENEETDGIRVEAIMRAFAGEYRGTLTWHAQPNFEPPTEETRATMRLTPLRVEEIRCAEPMGCGAGTFLRAEIEFESGDRLLQEKMEVQARLLLGEPEHPPQAIVMRAATDPTALHDETRSPLPSPLYFSVVLDEAPHGSIFTSNQSRGGHVDETSLATWQLDSRDEPRPNQSRGD